MVNNFHILIRCPHVENGEKHIINIDIQFFPKHHQFNFALNAMTICRYIREKIVFKTNQIESNLYILYSVHI